MMYHCTCVVFNPFITRTQGPHTYNDTSWQFSVSPIASMSAWLLMNKPLDSWILLHVDTSWQSLERQVTNTCIIVLSPSGLSTWHGLDSSYITIFAQVINLNKTYNWLQSADNVTHDYTVTCWLSSGKKVLWIHTCMTHMWIFMHLIIFKLLRLKPHLDSNLQAPNRDKCPLIMPLMMT